LRTDDAIGPNHSGWKLWAVFVLEDAPLRSCWLFSYHHVVVNPDIVSNPALRVNHDMASKRTIASNDDTRFYDAVLAECGTFSHPCGFVDV